MRVSLRIEIRECSDRDESLTAARRVSVRGPTLVEYQSAKRGVNAAAKFRAVRRILIPGIVGLILLASAAGAETVTYSTSDDVTITAEFYRGSAGREAVVLFHRTGSQGKEFGALSSALVAQGFHVLAPDLRGHGRSGTVARAPRAADSSAWLRDGPAAVAYLQSVLGMEVRIVLVGIERGAEIAARTMSGTLNGGTPLVLLDPDGALTGLAILQSASEASGSVLIVAGREDARARDAARALFLLRPASQLWLLDGGARIVDRLLSRADFATDLAAWITNATGS